MVSACLAIGLVTAVLGLPPSLNGLIAAKLGISGTDLTWVGEVAFVGAAASAYLFGSLAERFGRRRLLLISTALAVAGQLISSLAGSVQVLWLGQGLAGIGVGGLSVASLAVVLYESRSPAARARNLAAFAGSLTLGGVVSALLDGFIAAHAPYGWAFFAMAMIGALVLAAIALLCAESRADSPGAMDVPGHVSLIVALCAGLWAVIEGSADGWSSAGVVAAIVISAVSLITFVALQRRDGSMLALDLFRVPSFSAAAATAGVSFFAFAGSVYVYALRTTVVQQRTALFSAMGLVIISVVSGMIGFVSSRFVSRRIGIKVLVAGGLLCFAAADFWLAQIPVSRTGFSTLLGFMILVGVGQAATVAGMTAAAVTAAGPEHEADAAGSQGVLRQVGAPLGVAVVGALVFGRSQSIFENAVHHLGLPARVTQQVSAVNGHAGVLGILASGLGEKVPAAGAAAVGALSTGLVDGARTVAVVCIVMAAIAAVTVGGWTRADAGAASRGRS